MKSVRENPLRFASINIELNKHLDRVILFLKNFNPDVVCFQELTSTHVKFFENSFGMNGHFLPMTNDNTESYGLVFGVGLYSSLPISDVSSQYYYGGLGNLPTFIPGDEKTLWRGVIQATVQKEGQFFTLATTHFTRTPDGRASEKQRSDLKKLLELLAGTSELILCGDFNAPRGQEIFSLIASRYKDNIPPQYTTSLDENLHRASDLRLMVDGLFSTPEYEISDVKLTGGVSDHMAVTALVVKKI